jgi:hypothetical protein
MTGENAMSNADNMNKAARARTPAVPAVVAAPASWIGFCGSVMVAIAAPVQGSAGDSAWLPAPYAALRGALPELGASALMLSGVAALVFAWWLLRPSVAGPHLDLRLVLALWAVPLAAGPLVLSLDAYGYADLGWSLLHGLDPYVTGLRTTGSPYVPGVPDYLDGVRWAYPGLGIAANGWSAALTGFHPYWGVVAQRLPAWGGVALMAFSLPRVADAVGVPREIALWFGLLNPVVVLHLLGGAHNDALMTGLGLLALCLAVVPRGHTAHRFIAASAVLGMAIAVKPQVGLLVVAVAGLPVRQRLVEADWWPRVRLLAVRTVACTAIALAAFLAVSFASGAGIGWLGLLDHLNLLTTISPADLVALAAGQAGADPGVVRAAAAVSFQVTALLTVVALLLWRTADPLAIVAWGSVAVVLGAPALHPWYVVLPLALLALVPMSRRARFYAAVVVVAYPVAAYTAALTLKAAW